MSAVLDAFIEAHQYPCWCGANEARVYCRQMFGRKFSVLVCGSCTTHRILPRALPESADASKLYNEDAHTRSRMLPATALKNSSLILRRMKDVGIEFSKDSVVVDIGCSEGLLIESIRQETGCDAYGVDVDERTIDRAMRQYPEVTFLKGLVQDVMPRLPKADLIVASAILEHVVDPIEFLVDLKKLLKNDGQIFLLTPNSSSFHYRLARSWWRELLAVGEHIYLFNPSSLAKLCDRAGVKTVQVGTDYDYLIFPKMAWPLSMKNLMVFPWSWLRFVIKLLCMQLPHRMTGDILYARLTAPSAQATSE